MSEEQRRAQVQANAERTRAAGMKPGPSGMPMQHFIQANSRKDAFDRAQNLGYGHKPVHDTKHALGQLPHFHPTTSSGGRGNQNTAHVNYSPHNSSLPSPKNSDL